MESDSLANQILHHEGIPFKNGKVLVRLDAGVVVGRIDAWCSFYRELLVHLILDRNFERRTASGTLDDATRLELSLYEKHIASADGFEEPFDGRDQIDIGLIREFGYDIYPHFSTWMLKRIVQIKEIIALHRARPQFTSRPFQEPGRSSQRTVPWGLLIRLLNASN